MIKRPKIGLALGGGGARGLAHIGVLKVFNRENIPIDILTGSSAGAIISSMYAQYEDSDFIEEKVRKFIESPDFESIGVDQFVEEHQSENILSQIAEDIKERLVINIALRRKSIGSNKQYKKAISFLLNEGDISETKKKLGIVACDIVKGDSVLFTSGDIQKVTLASSSVPGYLPPVMYDSYTLIDGAVLSPIPILEAYKMGADIVIGIDVMPDLVVKSDQHNILDIIMRESQMLGVKYSQLLNTKADYIVRPDVGRFHWADFREYDYLIKAGEKIAQQKLREIESIITKKHFIKKKIYGWVTGSRDL